MRASAPTITSAASVDIYYDAENPAEQQFAYRIAATGATAYEATGLPPNALLDPTTGWINGNSNTPGTYNVAVRASNAEGTATTTVRLAIHPTVIGVMSSPGVFHAGQALTLLLHYNTTVVVTGSPLLALAIGLAGAPLFKDATYVSGSGTNELVFQYVVSASDDDPDGVQLLPHAPTGGTICDSTGLAASPSLPVRHFVSGITVIAASSGPIVKAVTEASAGPAQAVLLNVSARLRVVEGDASRSLIAGFVIAGAKAKRVLVRAIGPALTAFGVPGALADPHLRLYSSSGALVAENDNWAGNDTSAAATSVGAFALSPGTRDAAVVITLAPGAYTLLVSPHGGDGVALAEVYDVDGEPAPGGSAIINLSTRGQIDGDGNPLIAGFTVRGNGSRRVLIRGIGPALTKFGVGGALEDPTLKIYRDGQLIAQNDDWTTAASEIVAANSATGAFALAADSKDAAIVLALPPGAYTAVVSGVGDASGVGLVEVYDLPVGG